MKELITGGSGLIGSYIVRGSPRKKIVAPSREELDITSWISIKDFFDRVKPDIVIHLAAQTGIFKGEKERGDKKGIFWQTNVEGTRNIVRACATYKSYLIHISPEVVFAGTKERPGPYTEDDPPEDNPNLLSWYGWTKREAEIIVFQEISSAVVVRLSSFVGRDNQPRPDYARKILQAFDERKLPPMFTDQYIGLTYQDEFLQVLKKLIKERLPGIFHVASTNQFTPFEFANFLLEKARGVKEIVKPGSIEDFLRKHPLTFPQFSGLKIEKTQKKLGVKFSTWQEMLEKIVENIKEF